jgi:hypothetical protein
MIHFTWAISNNKNSVLTSFLIRSSKALIKSANNLDAYFSISIPKSDCSFFHKYFHNIAEIVPYENELLWESMPKWNITPRAEIVLGLDSDLVLFNNLKLIEYAEKSLKEKAIIGTIAFEGPWKGKSEWNLISNKYNVLLDFIYRHHGNKQICPAYINNGAVLIPADKIEYVNFYIKKWTDRLRQDYLGNYFFTQIVMAMVIADSKLNFIEAPIDFNFIERYIEVDKSFNFKNVALFHYHWSKNNFLNNNYCKFL